MEDYFPSAARNEDMIVNAGCSIAGLQVQAALLSHDAVDECAVICALDEARVAIVEARLVLTEGVRPDATPAQTLQGHVKGTIAFFKYPRSVVSCESLPKTTTGMIQRFRLASGGQKS